MLAIRLAEAADGDITSADLFTPEFLLDRPLLKAIRHTAEGPAVLLDRRDRPIRRRVRSAAARVPRRVVDHGARLGTFTAPRPPIVILTSNRSRELHDALKRRCYYHWIDYPTVERAAAIVRRRVPGASTQLVDAATAFVSSARSLDLDKPPGLAEAIDWVHALHALGLAELERPIALATVGSIAKTPDDHAAIRAAIDAGLPAAGVPSNLL